MFSFIDNVWNENQPAIQGAVSHYEPLNPPKQQQQQQQRQPPPAHLMEQMQRDRQYQRPVYAQHAQKVMTPQRPQLQPIQPTPNHPLMDSMNALNMQIHRLNTQVQKSAANSSKTSKSVPLDVILAILVVGFVIVIVLLFSVLKRVSKSGTYQYPPPVHYPRSL